MTHTITIETKSTFLSKGKVVTRNLEQTADDFTEELISVQAVQLPARRKRGSEGNPPPTADEIAPAPVAAAANTPEGSVQNYCDLVSARKASAAYACFSEAFRQRRSLKTYLANFRDTESMDILSARTEAMPGRRSTAVNVRMKILDGEGRVSFWSGPIGLVPEDGQWKINDMNQLAQERQR